MKPNMVEEPLVDFPLWEVVQQLEELVVVDL